MLYLGSKFITGSRVLLQYPGLYTGGEKHVPNRYQVRQVDLNFFWCFLANLVVLKLPHIVQGPKKQANWPSSRGNIKGCFWAFRWNDHIDPESTRGRSPSWCSWGAPPVFGSNLCTVNIYPTTSARPVVAEEQAFGFAPSTPLFLKKCFDTRYVH